MEKNGYYHVVANTKTVTLKTIKRIRLTEWIDAKKNPPQREGWYNTKTVDGLEHGNRHYWQDGEFWEFGNLSGILKVKRSVEVSCYQGLCERSPNSRRLKFN